MSKDSFLFKFLLRKKSYISDVVDSRLQELISKSSILDEDLKILQKEVDDKNKEIIHISSELNALNELITCIKEESKLFNL